MTHMENEELVDRLDELIDSARVEIRLDELRAIRDQVERLEVELSASRALLLVESQIVGRARAAKRDIAEIERGQGRRISVHAMTFIKMIVDGAQS